MGRYHRRMPRIYFILVLMAWICAPISSAQVQTAQSSTETKLELLREEIVQEEQLLAQTEQEEQASEKQLADLNRQLSLREALVHNYGNRIAQLRFERDSLGTSIQKLNTELDVLKSEYHSRASHAYRYGRQHDAALILSAASINQMLVRIGYLRRFSQKRRTQLTAIQRAADLLSGQRTEMQRKLVESEMMLVTADREQEKLDDLRKDVRTILSQIRSEKELQEESLTEKRTMEQQLVELIRSYLNVDTANTSSASLAETAASFAARGIMEWPSEGTVTEPFGEIVHPEFGTRTPNPGILISTPPGSEVKSVFRGTVSTIEFIPDMGRFVIVEHGNFHTVYGNFSMFYISVGDEVEAGQLIGRSGTEAEPRGEAVFFGVFKDGVPLDPSNWLER